MGIGREILEDWTWYRHMPGTRGVLLAPGFWICAAHRLGWGARQARNPLARVMLNALYAPARLAVRALTGADIHPGARLGQRFTVRSARGIMIADGVTIGDDCVINDGVSLVSRAAAQGEGMPALGDRVVLGPGARVAGRVRVGDGARIEADAVVLDDVPPESVAAGVPAVARPKRMGIAAQGGFAAGAPETVKDRVRLNGRLWLRLRARARARARKKKA